MARIREMTLIGSLPPPEGGTTIPFRDLCDHFRLAGVPIKVCDLGRKSAIRKAIELAVVALSPFNHRRLFFNVSSQSGCRLVPLIVILAKATGKEVFFRGFGGDFDVAYSRLSIWRKWLMLRAMRSMNLALLETRSQVEFFRKLSGGSKLYWFPNTRTSERSPPNAIGSAPNMDFVFVGKVCREKGLLVLFDAARQLPSGVSVDIFGSVEDLGIMESAPSNVVYRGVLPSSEVIEEISKYRALVLPTFWEGEGYPGVILEAYFAGTEVITTDWRAISEIAPSSVVRLVPPNSADKLALAMIELLNATDEREQRIAAQFEILETLDRARWNSWLLQQVGLGHSEEYSQCAR